MKQIGLILVIAGIALFIFVIYLFIKSGNRLLSPVPDEKGVKVIFITPTK